jgi:hypothetical protein
MTIVGVLVAGNLLILTARFNRYVDTTLGRDYAQEQCQAQLVELWQRWITYWESRGNQPGLPPGYIGPADVTRFFDENPIPHCAIAE